MPPPPVVALPTVELAVAQSQAYLAAASDLSNKALLRRWFGNMPPRREARPASLRIGMIAPSPQSAPITTMPRLSRG